MGPVIANPESLQHKDGDTPQFVLRPYEGSKTFRNLMATLRATIHVTDDVTLFARSAIGRLDDTKSLVRASSNGRFAILRQCHRWFSVEVANTAGTPPRFEMTCRLVESAIEAPFFGFNRAKHAVLEAAILATRTHLIDEADLRHQLEALRPAVEKTAGKAESDAFEMLEKEIERRIRDARSEP